MASQNDQTNPWEAASPRSNRFTSIDEEIAADIETLRNGKLSALYSTDRFKQHRHAVDIYYPCIEYPLGHSILKNPDWIRFQLSLYPAYADLKLVDSIILRPRHIESGNVELMALYLRTSRTLVHYLYLPHDCVIEGSVSAAYNEFIPYEKNRTINRSFHRAESTNDTTVSPLLYIISLLPGTGGNDIDKFFLRHDSSDSDLLKKLDEISNFYQRQGY